MKTLPCVLVSACISMLSLQARSQATISVKSPVGDITASGNWCLTNAANRGTATGTISVGFDMTISAFSVSMSNILQSGAQQTPYVNQSYNMGFSLVGPDGVTKALLPLYSTYEYEYWTSGSLANIEFRGQVTGSSLVSMPNVYEQSLAGVSMGSYPNSSWWAQDNLTYYNGKSSKGTWKLNVTSVDDFSDAGFWSGCPHTVTVAGWQLNFRGTYAVAAITNLTSPYTLFSTTQINVGATASQIVTVQNTGAQPLQILGLLGQLGATADYKLGTPLPLSIAPGSSANVSIIFKPLDVGSRVAQYSLVTSGVNAATTPPTQQNFTINMFGASVSPVIDPQWNGFLDHTPVAIADSVVRYFKVRNAGNSMLKIQQWSSTGQPVGPGLTITDFMDQTGRMSTGAADYMIVYPPQLVSGVEWDLPGNTIDSIGLKFKPSGEGVRTALMTLRSNASKIKTSQGVTSSDSLSYVLQGLGAVAKMEVAVLGVGAVNQDDSAVAVITVHNTGTGDLRFFSQALTTGDLAKFKILKLFPQIVRPDSTGSMRVQFTPGGVGMWSATIRLETNCLSADSVRTIDVQGVGRISTSATLSPKDLFRTDTTEVGGSAVPGCISIHNTGTTVLFVDRVDMIGKDAPNYSVTSPLPIQIDAGLTKQLCLTFQPQVGHFGASTAKAVIRSNHSNGGSDTVGLFGFSCQRSTRAAPESLFVNVIIDTSEKIQDELTLSNPGNCPVNIRNVSIIGPDSDLYRIVGTAPVMLAPGASSTVVLEFKSDRVNLITPTASLVVETDSPIDSVVTLPLLARGCFSEVLALPAPRSTLFSHDRTPVGATNSEVVLLQNTGCVPLQVTSVLIDGVDAKEYALLYAPSASSPILAHAIDSVVVAINRQTEGDKTAQLHILTNSNEIQTLSYGLGVDITDVRNSAASVSAFALYQNFPNPFNPATVIVYDLADAGKTTLEVLNPVGERVALLENAWRSAGRHRTEFDAAGLPSGAYIYRLTAGGHTVTRVMNVIK